MKRSEIDDGNALLDWCDEIQLYNNIRVFNFNEIKPRPPFLYRGKCCVISRNVSISCKVGFTIFTLVSHNLAAT